MTTTDRFGRSPLEAAGRGRYGGQSPFQALERERRQRLLITTSTIVAIATGVLGAVYLVLSIVQNAPTRLFNVGQCIFALAISLVARQLGARGRTILGSSILLGFMIVSASAGGFAQGGDVEEMALAYVIVIVLGSTLLGPPGDLIIMSISIVLWLAQLVAVNLGLVPEAAASSSGFPITAVVLALAVFLFTALIIRTTIITVQRALADATYDLTQAGRQLDEANRLKSQFMARTSHELRTPLNAITGYTDMALRGMYGPIVNDLRDPLTRVLRNAKRLESLIADLLDLSKIEVGELTLTEKVFPVRSLVEAVQYSLGPVAEEKGLEFTATIAPEMPADILGDETRLTQIVTNLVDNAIKFTDHGSVRLLIEPVPGERWRIEVRDTGRGILEEDYERIFEPFRQVGPATSTARGAGLGLAITRQLADIMRGEVRVNSQIGKGSVFEVHLPLKVTEPATNTTAAPA